MIVIFFCLQYPQNGSIGLNTIQSWWGNSVFIDTADYKGTPLRTLAEGETFGYAYIILDVPVVTDTIMQPRDLVIPFNPSTSPTTNEMAFAFREVSLCIYCHPKPRLLRLYDKLKSMVFGLSGMI